jgi:hypothetical protein
MPPKESQKQKQKQTVIVNIGDKVVKKKRKRKPRMKAAPRAPPPPPPSPFAPQDFARVIFQPQPPLRPDENLAVQLNSVTKQLNELQEKQKNRTGNLMAGQKAVEREAQQLGDPEPEPDPEPAAAEELIATPEVKAKRRGRPPGSKNRLKEPLATAEEELPPQPVAEPKLTRSASAPEGLVKSRKQRSDKGESRGQLFTTVARQTLAQGARLATILPTPPAPEEEELGEQGGSEQGGMVFA